MVLKAQKNAVLGAISKASVEIVDPRHGKFGLENLLGPFKCYTLFCFVVHSLLNMIKTMFCLNFNLKIGGQ